GTGFLTGTSKAFVIKNSSAVSVSLPITGTAVQDQMNTLVKVGTTAASSGLDQRVLTSLYDELYLPLEKLIPAGANLIISPEGPLNTLPFAALYDGKQYLLDHNLSSL